MNGQSNNQILIYTRLPHMEYSESLSNSIHLAYSMEGKDFTPLNQNYGILFALATIDQNNVIQEKGLKKPYLFRTEDGTFGIIAIRVDKEGNEDAESKGHILLWTSKNLIDFKYQGLVKLHSELFVEEAICHYNMDEKLYEIHWKGKDDNYYMNHLHKLDITDSVSLPKEAKPYTYEGNPFNLINIIPGNTLTLNETEWKEIKDYWLPLHNTEIIVPEKLEIRTPDELKAVKATAIYSDGSTSEKEIQWDYTGIDFSHPGIYQVKGRVVQEVPGFPLARGYADPVILPWNNKYYFIATNDNVNDIGIFVREADTIPELFAPGYREAVILDYDEEKGFIQTFWAPEFHVIGGDLYILFAVGGKQWAPQCHMMKLRKGGDIMSAKDWSTPIRVKRADGTYLTEDGITLDMTYFHADGTSCVVWSYRKNIGTPMDTGSMLYIATIDEANPTVLTSEPVLLTRPLYGWENIKGTINNEGPYPLVTEDKVYITYSGGAACGYTYAVGLLSIPRGKNYLDVKEWTKASTPVLSYYTSEGVYGPGHNSFFRDYQGNTMIMYHGEEDIVDFGVRCSAMHRVHFNKKGMPVFHMTKERDLNPNLCDLMVEVKVL